MILSLDLRLYYANAEKYCVSITVSKKSCQYRNPHSFRTLELSC